MNDLIVFFTSSMSPIMRIQRRRCRLLVVSLLALLMWPAQSQPGAALDGSTGMTDIEIWIPVIYGISPLSHLFATCGTSSLSQRPDHHLLTYFCLHLSLHLICSPVPIGVLGLLPRCPSVLSGYLWGKDDTRRPV